MIQHFEKESQSLDKGSEAKVKRAGGGDREEINTEEKSYL